MAAEPRVRPQQVQTLWSSLLSALVAKRVLTPSEAAEARLEISSDPTLRDTPRHFAAAENGGRGPVLIHRSALRLPRQNLVAILAHEMGHVIDQSAFNTSFARALRGDETKLPSDGEKRADALAQKYLGTTIRYDRDLVQTLGAGRPRPRGCDEPDC